MRFLHRGRRAAIAVVTGRAAKLFGIVNLQKLFARMTNESDGQIIGLLAGRRHVLLSKRQRFAGAEMANLTAVHDAVLINVELVIQDRVVEGAVVLSNQVVDVFLREAADMVLEIVIALLCEFARLFQNLGLLTQQFCFLFAQAVERVFELLKIHLLAIRFSRRVRRQIDGHNFTHFRVALMTVIVFPEVAGRGLQLERDDDNLETAPSNFWKNYYSHQRDAKMSEVAGRGLQLERDDDNLAALILEGIGHRVEIVVITFKLE